MLRNILQLLCSSLLLFSCINRSENLHVYQSLHDNLNHSTAAINNSTEDVFVAMQEKLQDPITKTKAEIWHPKMQQIRKSSKEAFDYVNSLKNELIITAGLDATDKKAYRESDYGAVNKVFFHNKRGEQLYNMLTAYIDTIRAIDPKLSGTFSKAVLTSKIIDRSITNSSQFTDTHFRNIPAIAAMVILSRFQNGIRIIENSASTFCLESMTNHAILDCRRTSALAGLSTSVVQKGKEIKLTAGIGEFKTSGNPEIVIDGKRIALNERGYIDYKFTAPTKPGKYSKKVQFHHTNAEGNKMTLESVLEYTVVDY